MGQSEEDCAVGGGTVRIGRCEVVEMGGEGLGVRMGVSSIEGLAFEVGWMGVKLGVVEERETVLSTETPGADDGLVLGEDETDGFDFEVGYGRPDMMGGGRLRPSVAFRDSCLAKSEACHHSRNLRANMEVGSRIFKLEKRFGTIVVAKIRGLKILVVWPGRAPGLLGEGTGGCAASAIAL